MGVTPAALQIISDMAQKKMFTGLPLTLIELGSQEVHCHDHELIEKVFDSFGIGGEQKRGICFGEKARTLFEYSGFSYECVDLDGLEKTRAWDINTIQCPEEFRGKFALTTNHGTTEHLIGQDNAFCLLHDLTAVGGYMMHTVPCTGQVNHGFFSYSPVFFSTLAKTNNYEMKYFFLTDFTNLMHYQNDMVPAFSYIITVLQKTNNLPYQRPLQIWDWNSLKYMDSCLS
jgi:hypothetical protein